MKETCLSADVLFDTAHSLLGAVLAGLRYPWEILPDLKARIAAAGKALPKTDYEEIAPNVWAAKNAKIAPSASITGPTIIGPETEVRHGAYIRGGTLVGAGCVVGNSCELKNCILFDEAKVPHYNYIGDSILGFGAHLGAGAVTSNVKSDKTNVAVRWADGAIATGLRKFGALVGDGVEVGCNCVLCPGSVIGRGSIVYPLTRVRGVIDAGVVCKSMNEIVVRREREA